MASTGTVKVIAKFLSELREHEFKSFSDAMDHASKLGISWMFEKTEDQLITSSSLEDVQGQEVEEPQEEWYLNSLVLETVADVVPGALSPDTRRVCHMWNSVLTPVVTKDMFAKCKGYREEEPGKCQCDMSIISSASGSTFPIRKFDLKNPSWEDHLKKLTLFQNVEVNELRVNLHVFTSKLFQIPLDSKYIRAAHRRLFNLSNNSVPSVVDWTDSSLLAFTNALSTKLNGLESLTLSLDIKDDKWMDYFTFEFFKAMDKSVGQSGVPENTELSMPTLRKLHLDVQQRRPQILRLRLLLWFLRGVLRAAGNITELSLSTDPQTHFGPWKMEYDTLWEETFRFAAYPIQLFVFKIDFNHQSTVDLISSWIQKNRKEKVKISDLTIRCFGFQPLLSDLLQVIAEGLTRLSIELDVYYASAAKLNKSKWPKFPLLEDLRINASLVTFDVNETMPKLKTLRIVDDINRGYDRAWGEEDDNWDTEDESTEDDMGDEEKVRDAPAAPRKNRNSAWYDFTRGLVNGELEEVPVTTFAFNIIVSSRTITRLELEQQESKDLYPFAAQWNCPNVRILKLNGVNCPIWLIHVANQFPLVHTLELGLSNNVRGNNFSNSTKYMDFAFTGLPFEVLYDEPKREHAPGAYDRMSLSPLAIHFEYPIDDRRKCLIHMTNLRHLTVTVELSKLPFSRYVSDWSAYQGFALMTDLSTLTVNNVSKGVSPPPFSKESVEFVKKALEPGTIVTFRTVAAKSRDPHAEGDDDESSDDEDDTDTDDDDEDADHHRHCGGCHRNLGVNEGGAVVAPEACHNALQ